MSRISATEERVCDGENALPTGLLLSADKLAELLDISTRTLWRLRAAGKLPSPVRLGGSVRWRVETIRDWIEAGCPDCRAG